MDELSERIDQRVGEVRTEALDMSFGEIVSLHVNSELIIQPEYQRLFRWSDEQKSRLIESILLELPIPQFFVIENDDGVLELIDGLQRISSVMQFIEPTTIGRDALVLTGCDLVAELNGQRFDDLPLRLRLRIKRTSVRTVIIKRQSQSFLRYEMFKRLNTGGDILSPQEIRNCSVRMVGQQGVAFYAFLVRCAEAPEFHSCIEPLSEADLVKKGDEELVLRFFALKNGQNLFRGSVRDWLDSYMEAVLLGRVPFAEDEEFASFQQVFSYLNRSMGGGAFVKYRDNERIGALAPAYFEAVTGAVHRVRADLERIRPERIGPAVVAVVQTAEFRDVTGPGANTQWKLERRIGLVEEALRALAE